MSTAKKNVMILACNIIKCSINLDGYLKFNDQLLERCLARRSWLGLAPTVSPSLHSEYSVN